MNEYGFVGCENALTHKCKGEVINLLSVAERYGILMEESRERIESICRQCKNFSPAGINDYDAQLWQT